MRKILLFVLMIISFPQVVFSAESKLPYGVEVKGNALILHTEWGIADIGKKHHLKQNILEVVKRDQFSTITIDGMKNYLGHTLEDIANLELKELKVLDLDLFYAGEDNLNENQDYLKGLFKKFPGLNIRMRMCDELIKEFTIIGE